MDNGRIFNCNMQRTSALLDLAMENVFILESLLKIAKNNYINCELNSYSFDEKQDIGKIISVERNDYINVLTIALNQIDKIKDSQLKLELNYINTPTIAADK